MYTLFLAVLNGFGCFVNCFLSNNQYHKVLEMLVGLFETPSNLRCQLSCY